MTGNKDKNLLLDLAGRAGLILGGTSTLYLALSVLMGYIPDSCPRLVSILASLLGFLLWVLKFWACLFLMKKFMVIFARRDGDSLTRSRLLRFGFAAAFFSALVYSAAYFIDVKFIQPDMFADAIDAMAETGLMPSSQIELMEQMIPGLPRILFFSNLIYCWLFGAVLTLIYARGIILPGNPFGNNQQ